ncbi:hypothetical protein P6144_06280 [Sphingomonas sp. HITSZ_GF]|uniref:hypothetical protein n=1 Tax=Sphingomonas sp. HITSZ_GF TaxID=3037247 RepID=UPI00240D6384|nr:hypothetical protein [Sphingomonas sp. HITSZ_GF]MDG2533246.1 hypothetical protein [Sphingomonas sp. HITSZ_GF]
MAQMVPRWWETRWFALVAILASCVPLLWPALPPLVDLPAHIGRYHIAAAIGDSADLQRHYSYQWALIGNLGVDGIVYALTPLMGVEAAAKWTVVTIPLLTTAALAWLSRESGGRRSPAMLAAFPLAYSYAFLFGFVNFALASGLAIAALALWIRLGRQHRLALRAALFVPISFLLWVVHSFGWGMFGLFAFAAELARLRVAGKTWRAAILGAVLACIPLGGPALLTLHTQYSSVVYYQWRAKPGWIASLLRDRWKWFDVASVLAIAVLLYTALRRPGWRFDPTAGAAALTGLLVFLVFPFTVAAGAYADMRLLGPAAAIALVAVRPPPQWERAVAIGATLFFVVRTAAGTISMLLAAQPQQQALEAVAHIPRGAAVLVLAQENCATDWVSRRLGHISGIAVARRDVFESGQWMLPGQQLLLHRHERAEPYASDPSQLVYPVGCAYRPTDPATAIRDFDRGTFTHVWVIGFRPQPALARDVKLVWSNGMSSLYRVDHIAGLSGSAGRR